MPVQPASWESLAGDLTRSLQLAQSPIAIAFVDQAPEGVPFYAGSAPAGCYFWQEASRRVFATVPRDHELCAIGVYTHHLPASPAAQTDLQDALGVFAQLGYVRPEDIPLIPVLKRESRVVVYGPLADFPVTPDVILLFVTAEQTLILAEASQQTENNLPPALGRPACAIVPQAIETGRTALSLGCCGARQYLDQFNPNLALYAIPGPALAAFTERVIALAQANQTLARFHDLRRRDIEAGARPTIQESLAAL